MSVTAKILDQIVALAGDAIAGVTTFIGYKPHGDIVGNDLPFLQVYGTDQATGSSKWGQTSTEVGFQMDFIADAGTTSRDYVRDRLEYLRRLIDDDPTLGGNCIRAEVEDVQVAEVPSLNRNVARASLRAEVWDLFEVPSSWETITQFAPPDADDQGAQDWGNFSQNYGGEAYTSRYCENGVDLTLTAGGAYGLYICQAFFSGGDKLDLSEAVPHVMRFRFDRSLVGKLVLDGAGAYGYVQIGVSGGVYWAFNENYRWDINAEHLRGGWVDFEFDPESPDTVYDPFGGTSVDTSSIGQVAIFVNRTAAANLVDIDDALTIDRLYKLTKSPS